MLLNQSGGGWILAESDGLFPIAWCVAFDNLDDVLRRFGGAPLLVPKNCAGVDILKRLDAQGLGFVTDAPPTRGERWRSIRRPEGRWWTNILGPADGVLVAGARSLGPSSEVLAACWSELAERRLSIVPAGDEALERSLALAAGAALAEIAWTLWRTDGGGTDPLLTLERFGDLDARVRFDADQVRLALPLGKRSLDLAKHHLLDDVAGVPWLGGRVVRFSGG